MNRNNLVLDGSIQSRTCAGGGGSDISGGLISESSLQETSDISSTGDMDGSRCRCPSCGGRYLGKAMSAGGVTEKLI